MSASTEILGRATECQPQLKVRQVRVPKTPYLLALALSKFLLEFTKQPIRSGSRSEKSNYPLRQLNIKISNPSQGMDDMSWIMFAAFARFLKTDCA
jgi:hypothetical protein